MHSNDNEIKIRDISTSSQSSTEDLMATGMKFEIYENYNQTEG